MGRKGPILVPFLQNALANKKYRNLISDDPYGLKFSIILPHKTKRLPVEDQFLFKDWYALNGKKYVFHTKHYTDAKQAIMASLRKSDYVKKVDISDHKITYIILNEDQVKEIKKQKQELKKLNRIKETSDSDDGSSSIESGYSSGPDSPHNDHAQVSLNDDLVIQNGYELSPMFNTMDNLFGMSQCTSDKFDGAFKSEPMDASISTENYLAAHDTPTLFKADLFSNIQPFVDNLKSDDYFPENMATHSLDLMDCTNEAPDLSSSDFAGPLLPFENENDFLKLDSLYDKDSLLKDAPAFNTNPSVVREDNQASETQNGHGLPTEPEDIFDEELWNKLIESLSDIEAAALEGKGQDEISLSPNAGSPDQKTGENLYLCKNCVHLGKVPILFCEPQFERKSTETSDELKIVFDEAVLNKINGFKSVKEWKFINDYLMVILEPNDD